MKSGGRAAPPMRRLIAYAVDWYLSAILSGLPLLLANAMRTGLPVPDTSLPPGSSGWWYGGAGTLLGLLYYMLPLLRWEGQTPGKRLLGLRVITLDGDRLSLRQVLIRQAAGLLLLEGVLVFPSQLLRELFARVAGGQAAQILQYAMVGVAIVSVLMGIYSRQRQMLHDRLAGTFEIYTHDEDK